MSNFIAWMPIIFFVLVTLRVIDGFVHKSSPSLIQIGGIAGGCWLLLSTAARMYELGRPSLGAADPFESWKQVLVEGDHRYFFFGGVALICLAAISLLSLYPSTAKLVDVNFRTDRLQQRIKELEEDQRMSRNRVDELTATIREQVAYEYHGRLEKANTALEEERERFLEYMADLEAEFQDSNSEALRILKSKGHPWDGDGSSGPNMLA